jgi:hypothetical protein
MAYADPAGSGARPFTTAQTIRYKEPTSHAPKATLSHANVRLVPARDPSSTSMLDMAISPIDGPSIAAMSLSSLILPPGPRGLERR